VLDEHLDLAIDVLADLVVDPLLRPEDLDLEREVVLEEIATVEDTPDDLVFDLHASALFDDHPYGYSILGTRETVAALTAGDLRRVHEREYRRSNLVIAAAGSVDHDRFLESVRRCFERTPNGRGPGGVPPVPPVRPREVRVERPASQTHIVMGTRVFDHGDPRRYALVMLCNAFGGGMSSRLFQRVREELGLAYAVHAFQTFYQHAGVCGVYVGTRPEWADRAADVIREECDRLARAGLTADELDDVKGQVKGHVVLSLESSSSRMHRLAGTELYGEPYLEIDEIMRRVDAVTLEDVHALAAEFFDPARQVVMRLGPESKTARSPHASEVL